MGAHLTGADGRQELSQLGLAPLAGAGEGLAPLDGSGVAVRVGPVAGQHPRLDASGTDLPEPWLHTRNAAADTGRRRCYAAPAFSPVPHMVDSFLAARP